MAAKSVSRYRYSTVIPEGSDVYLGQRVEYDTSLATDDSFYVVRADDDLSRIAAKTLGDARYWWVVADFNAITSPFDTLVEGTELRVPSKRRLFMQVLR